MNCANHADASAVAYCRTCGKALCANCTRPVRGVIYCEDCLGAKDGRRSSGSGGIRFRHGSPSGGAGAGSSTAASSGKRQRAQPDRRRNSGRILSLRRGRRVHRAICQGTGASGHFRFARRRGERQRQRTQRGSGRSSAASASPSFTSTRSLMRCARQRRSRWRNRCRIPSAWRQLLAAGPRSRPARSRWVRSCSFCSACSSCCIRWAVGLGLDRFWPLILIVARRLDVRP